MFFKKECLIFQHKCYIVATCDKDLKRRIRKIPGVPIMYLQQHKYVLINLLIRERSGMVVEDDSESRGPGFDPPKRHRVVSLSKTH